MSKRNDIHRPSVLVPEDYAYALEYAAATDGGATGWPSPPINVREAVELYREKGAHVHGGIFQCDVCCARFTYGTLFLHAPTGEVISVGHDCADKLELMCDLGSREHVRALSLAARQRRERRAGWADWLKRDDHRDLARCQHEIARDILGRMKRRGWEPSEKQLALLRKLRREELTPKVEEVQVAAPIVDGRQTVEGTIVSAKVVESSFGMSLKLTVKVETEDGVWLAWGTAPRSLQDALDAEYEAAREAFYAGDCNGSQPSRGELRGRRVRFDAKLLPGREPHFALFKRPTKAELVG